MAEYYTWNPYGVALEIAASGSNVKRTSATQFTVTVSAEWKTYYNGAATNYGMDVTSGGVTKTISSFGTSRSSGSTSFTGTYSISGNGAATKTITVAFRNYNTDKGQSSTKNITFNVTVPAWTSYVVSYNANGGTGAPGNQTKWKGQTLKLSTTKPTRTGYTFLGWSTSSSASSATYAAGANYTTDAATPTTILTLYAVWKANTYTIKYDANGGTGAPTNQTKTYGQQFRLSTTEPTRAKYIFVGWGTSASATKATYQPGGSYTNNAAITLYAVWELAYENPRITNLVVARCNSSGQISDSGTGGKISFNWTTWEDITSITVDWTATDGTTISQSLTPSFDKAGVLTSGSALGGINVGELDVESSYTVTITVSDASGSTIVKRNLLGLKLPIDVLDGNKGLGVSIGKPAEKEDVFEVALHNEFLKSTRQVGNRYVYSSTGTTGESGYIKIANIEILSASDTWWPITFVLNRQKALTPMTVHMTLNKSTEEDSELSTFVYEGSNYGAFIVQTSPRIWTLYVQKANTNDTITIQDWYTSTSTEELISISFSDEQATSVPGPFHRAIPAQLRNILDFIYPVGSIYISYSQVNPSEMFGGTWERIENSFLWGCDSSGTIGQTGGEKTHTLTTSEIPSHTHGATYTGNATGTKKYPWFDSVVGSGTAIAYEAVATGGGQAHNNMPPYIQVAIWRRTA